MGSRARVAAAACVAASGLLFGGVGSAVAVADPGQTTSGDTSDRRTDAGESADGRSDTGESAGNPSRGDREDDKRDVAGGSSDDQGSGDGGEPAVREDDATVDPKAEDEPGVPPRGEDGEKEPPPPCCDDGEDDCWPWPWPPPDTDPPQSGNDGGYPGRPPVGLPFPIPPIGVPPEFPPPVGEPVEPEIADTVPGVGVAGTGLSGAPVSVPVLVLAPTGLGPGPAGLGAGPTGGGAGSSLPAAPRQGPAEPPRVREPLPATAGGPATLPASSFRVGYGEYLRSAGMAQIAVLAVPGLLGILVLTGAGGFVGYRQAKAGQAVRHSGVGRYMN